MQFLYYCIIFKLIIKIKLRLHFLNRKREFYYKLII